MSDAANELKNLGNRLFQQQRYEEAVAAYDKAILKNNTDAAYFTNRALCFLNLKQFDKAEGDCRRAMELDSRNVKAHYFLGKIALHRNQLDDAISLLTRAHETAYHQKQSYGDEISSLLRQARRGKFKREEDKRICQEIELHTYLNDLIDRDVEQRVNEVVEGGAAKEDVNRAIDRLKLDGESKKVHLNQMFAQVDDRRRRREIPDYLCGKISFELLKDPVITPSGITYDRNDIKEHLSRVGHFDPVTRVPLSVDQLIPNLAMKEVLDTFLAENEWAVLEG